MPSFCRKRRGFLNLLRFLLALFGKIGYYIKNSFATKIRSARNDSLEAFKVFNERQLRIISLLQSQEKVSGVVRVKLYKGNIIKAGTTSPYSLYNESLASFTTGDMYDHHDADGFITLFGLPLKVRAMKLAEVKNNQNQN